MWCQWRGISVNLAGHTALFIQSHFTKLNLKCNILCTSVVSTSYVLLQDLYKTPPNWNPCPSEIFPEALLQPLLSLPYIIAENNSTPKQTGKCLMILYPSMSSRCQWNIALWAHISFPSRRRATAGSRERGPATKFKHHFTPSNKEQMEEMEGRKVSHGTAAGDEWVALCWIFGECWYPTTKARVQPLNTLYEILRMVPPV